MARKGIPEFRYKVTVDKRYTQNFGYKDTAGKDIPRICVHRRGRKGIMKAFEYKDSTVKVFFVFT